MKTIFNLLFVVLLSHTVHAQFEGREPFIMKSFSNETVKELYAKTSGGSIVVAGGNEKARVEVYIQGNNGRKLSKDEIKKRLDEDYKLVIDVVGNELKLIAEQQDKYFNWKNALSISFKVFVPTDVSTDLSTSGGSISLKNLSGTQDFSTSGGSLELDRLSGRIKGRTSGGSIQVSNTKDYLDLQTSGGSIDAENCNGKLTLSTSGGGIRLNNLDGDIKVNTSGGPIRGDDIKGELIAHTSGGGIDLKNLQCSVDASTSGGNMDIDINKLMEYVTLNNSGGSIHVSLPSGKGVDLTLRGDHIRLENMSNFNGDKEDHKVDGKINGGGIPVNIKTSGSVTVALD